MSAINQPHPDDEFAPEENFGEPENGNGLPTLTDEQAAAEAAAYRGEKGEGEPQPAPAAAEVDEQVAEAAQQAAETPEQSGVPQDPDEAAEASQQPESSAEAQRGGPEREYIVLQRVSLTDSVLRNLLQDIEQGRAPEPVVTYMELHRVSTRNDRQAVVHAYKTHRERLGRRVHLAAISSRAFKLRVIEPDEQPQEPKLRIT